MDNIFFFFGGRVFYWPFKWYKLCSLSSRLIHFLFVLGAWLLFKASSAIVQLYHGKNKLILMRWRCSSLCSIPIRLLVCYPRLPLVFHHRLLLVFQPRLPLVFHHILLLVIHHILPLVFHHRLPLVFHHWLPLVFHLRLPLVFHHWLPLVFQPRLPLVLMKSMLLINSFLCLFTFVILFCHMFLFLYWFMIYFITSWYLLFSFNKKDLLTKTKANYWQSNTEIQNYKI